MKRPNKATAENSRKQLILRNILLLPTPKIIDAKKVIFWSEIKWPNTSPREHTIISGPLVPTMKF